MNENEEPIDELSQLKKEFNPPSHLEGKIVSSLMNRGLLRQRPSNWMKAVAAILIFGVGLGCGKFVWKEKSVEYTHVLLLKEDPMRFNAKGHETSLVREYSDWASSIRGGGTNITGEKLDVSRVLLPSANNADENEVIAGFFMFDVGSDETALKIAQHCPHLKYGGMIELRRIDAGRKAGGP